MDIEPEYNTVKHDNRNKSNEKKKAKFFNNNNNSVKNNIDKKDYNTNKHYNLSKQRQEYLKRVKGSVKVNINFKNIAIHHLESFNYSFTEILPILHKYIRPIEIKAPDSLKHIFGNLIISYDGFELAKPKTFALTSDKTKINTDIYPSECREREINYSSALFANIKRQFDTTNEEIFNVKLGDIPVMVKSKFCNLYNLKHSDCIRLKEDINDFGGYFIVNGNEKLLRMISIPRRNYMIGFVRPSYTKKTKNCSEYAVQMKCVREDMTSQTLTFHYINDGNIVVRLLLKKQEYLIPVGLLLKAIIDISDVDIYNKIVGETSNVKLKECVEVIIADNKKYGISEHYQFLDYIGRRFRDMLGFGANDLINNEDVGKIFIKEHIMIHVDSYQDKFNSISLCIQKLYMLAFKQIKPDNMDSSLNHEVLLSGHLYMMVLKEKLEEVLFTVKSRIQKLFNNYKEKSNLKSKSDINESNKATQKSSKSIKSEQILNSNFVKSEFDAASNLSRRMENFLATGNLISKTGLDLMQMGGYSILAEKLNNMRYIAHFRSIHRGQFFTEMKTTTPRKLLPDSWGFLCPVHTPDGSPCGLLNHISSGCDIVAYNTFDNYNNVQNIIYVCSQIGMNIIDQNTFCMSDTSYIVVLDGRYIGYVKDELIENFIESLRKYKVFGLNNIPENIEIGYVPKTKDINSNINNPDDINMLFPGVFIFTCIARMTRKVKNLLYNKEEIIGPLEQQYLNIACIPEDIINLSKSFNCKIHHQEIDPIRILSIIASLTPFCEYNQSPRNMYQCQMAKQTMGTPYYNYNHRIDNKTYRILFPQLPLVQTNSYNDYGFDAYPSGTNAVVAVLAYTGYDMEDAMILNKSSYERGLGYGIVYKSITKKLNENKAFSSTIKSNRYRMLNCSIIKEDSYMVSKSKISSLPNYIGEDGLPLIGTKLSQGMIELVYVDSVKNDLVIMYYKDTEPCVVDNIRIYNSNSLNPDEISINFILRFKRYPVIGDKFSSRHGQKGVMSCLWPHINMPFSETGITPDIIINPHAFPSRMTIGMLIESLAGKSGSLEGKFQCFSPFDQVENDDIISYFGDELLRNGYNHNGTEILYSGVSGLQMKADIYMGVVYYQRLRHMVNDKAQARSTGPIDILTRQPVKGRKNQGGIRFGEMERDGLLAHGVSYCLNDRLFKSSDYSEGYICKKCGELLAVLNKIDKASIKEIVLKEDLELLYKLDKKLENLHLKSNNVYCLNCKSSANCVKVSIPFVLRYLTNELAGMNIKLSFKSLEN